MVQTPAEAAQNKRDDGHGRGYAWGQGKKRLRPRKVIKEHKRNSGVRTDSRVTVEAARAQGLQTSAKAVSPQTSSGTGHTRLFGERDAMMQE